MSPHLTAQPLSVPTAALAWCRQVTQTHSQTFYRGSLLYPKGQREAVWAVYAACRVGDDIADYAHDQHSEALPQPDCQAELDRWWSQVQAAFAGDAGESQMQRALAWAVSRYPVPLAAFAELYEGFCMDLRGTTYHTLADLELYCRRVAGVVGFMIAPIGGYRGGEETLSAALALGQAMQLTNILRDVGEDLRLGRLYLPRELLRQFGVNLGDLQAGRITPEYRALLEHLCELTRELYTQGRAGIPLLSGRAKLGVAVAARLYAGILDELARGGYDNLNGRTVVSGRRKLWLTLREIDVQLAQPQYCPLHWAGQRLKA